MIFRNIGNAAFVRNLSYTTNVSSDIQIPRSELNNEEIAEFLTNFPVFGCLMKHDFRVYDIISETNPYLLVFL